MIKFFVISAFLLLNSPISAGLDFPGNNFFPDWKKSDNVLKFKANNLYGHINGGAELFLEFGFKELQVQCYSKGESEINLEIYQMENPAAALGIYLMKCGKETPLEGVSARNTGSAFQITAVKGDYFFQVNNFSGEAAFLPVMKMVFEFLVQQIPRDQPVELLDLLPKPNLISGSEKLIRGPYALQPIFTFGEGDVLLLNREIFAVFGDYQVSGGEKFSRLIIPYPDSVRAAATLKNLQENLDPYLTVIRKQETGFVFQDFQKKFGLVSQTKNVLEILIDLETLPEK